MNAKDREQRDILSRPEVKAWQRRRSEGQPMEREDGSVDYFPAPLTPFVTSMPGFEEDGATEFPRAPCPKCHSAECDLTADVIVGERNWYAAVGKCIAEQRRRALAERGITLPPYSSKEPQ